MSNTLLISKDVLRPDYLECYGGELHKTPNINKLAENGTLYQNYYSAAPSSAMSFTSMFTGLYPFEVDRKAYRVVKNFIQTPTLADELHKKNFEIHVIWAGKYARRAHKYSRVFGEPTNFHNLENIHEQIGAHLSSGEKIKVRSGNPVEEIYDLVKEIISKNSKKKFIWIHAPHVFLSRAGYGSDIDLFDNLVGKLFDFFDLNKIYLTADHGHMNIEKNTPVYGSHVYEGAIKIPLITPNFSGKNVVKEPLDNTQLKSIILNNEFTIPDFIYSDSRYYLQPDRILMIRKSNYKYLFNKIDNTEELYDLNFDCSENVNLLREEILERNRNKKYYLEETFHYPHWDAAKKAYNELRLEKDRIWKEGKTFERLLFKINSYRSNFFSNLPIIRTYSRKLKGRWGAKVRTNYYE